MDRAIQVWELDWEWDFPAAADWHASVRPYLQAFLQRHTPYVDGPRRSGTPRWSEGDLTALMAELADRGFGWLTLDGITAQLALMAAKYTTVRLRS